jgi:hypothetical protein
VLNACGTSHDRLSAGRSTLLLPERSPDADFWSGPLPGLDALAEACGVSHAAYTTDLPALLRENQGSDVHVVCEDDAATVRAALGISDTNTASPQGPSGNQEQQSINISGGRVMEGLLQPVLHRLR